MDAGLLLLRVVVGAIMAAHGAQKLFGWFKGPGLAGTAAGLKSMRFRPAKFHAVITGLSETGGGLLLALGLFTSLGAAAVVGVMIVAIITVHLRHGFFVTKGGYEFNLLIIASAIAVALAGPGEYSIDALARWSFAGADWGFGAFALALVAAASVLAARRPQAPPQEMPADERLGP